MAGLVGHGSDVSGFQDAADTPGLQDQDSDSFKMDDYATRDRIQENMPQRRISHEKSRRKARQQEVEMADIKEQ